jgi:Alcohol dehydrogenase transcription factor Myb/SANT-like
VQRERQEGSKKGVWDKIAKEMGKGFDGHYCDQKWRNLKESFKKFEDNKKKTGSAAKAVPACYAELHEILAENHTINPISTIDTLQQSTVDDVERDEPQKKKKHMVSLYTIQNVPFSKHTAYR